MTTSYTYDDADRLVQTDRDGRVTDHVLDEVGNRTEQTVTDALSSSSKAFSYNPRNQLQTIHLDGVLQSEYQYDANGNRVQATTAGITKEYHFGARDRLIRLNTQGSPPGVEWTYDDAGFRISETTPTEARRFRWDGETLSYETNVLGNLLIRYDHGPDRLLAETETTQTRTWLIDGLRTPVKRLNDDGSTYSQTVYDEYGKVESELSPDIPRFGFTGHQRGPAEDPDLYYAQQRYYNAATGRFVSEDPLWGMPETPLSLHRYLYAYANPTVYVDPDGLAAILRNREINDILSTAEQGSGLTIRSDALDALINERGLSEQVSVRFEGSNWGIRRSRYLSPEGVQTVAEILADAWSGYEAPTAFMVVESDDTPESVAAEYLNQVGDFGGVMSDLIAQQKGERARPGDIFDISMEVGWADEASRNRLWTQDVADGLRSRRSQMSSAVSALYLPSQLLWDTVASSDAAITYTAGPLLGGPRASAQVTRQAKVDAGLIGATALTGGVVRAGYGAMQYARGIGLQSDDIGYLMVATRRSPDSWNEFQSAVAGRGLSSPTERSRVYRTYNRIGSSVRGVQGRVYAVGHDIITGTGVLGVRATVGSGAAGAIQGSTAPLQPGDFQFSDEPWLRPFEVGVFFGGSLRLLYDCVSAERCH